MYHGKKCRGRGSAHGTIEMRRIAQRFLCSSTSAEAGVRYCARSHMWMRPLAGHRVRIGLTERGIDDIGEVDAFERLASVGATVGQSDALLRIDWQAMQISDGDELYHTRWANIEGDHTISAPCAATVVGFNEAAFNGKYVGGVLDAEEWLVELALTETDTHLNHLLGEADYMKATADSAGRFGVSEESLGYTSYG